MATEDGGALGPSWWDVERGMVDLQKRFGGICVWTLSLHIDPWNGAMSWSVHLLHTKRSTDPDKLGASRGAHKSFRGKGGAKTITSAMVLAILDLSEVLEDEERSKPQRFF